MSIIKGSSALVKKTDLRFLFSNVESSDNLHVNPTVLIVPFEEYVYMLDDELTFANKHILLKKKELAKVELDNSSKELKKSLKQELKIFQNNIGFSNKANILKRYLNTVKPIIKFLNKASSELYTRTDFINKYIGSLKEDDFISMKNLYCEFLRDMSCLQHKLIEMCINSGQICNQIPPLVVPTLGILNILNTNKLNTIVEEGDKLKAVSKPLVRTPIKPVKGNYFATFTYSSYNTLSLKTTVKSSHSIQEGRTKEDMLAYRNYQDVELLNMCLEDKYDDVYNALTNRDNILIARTFLRKNKSFIGLEFIDEQALNVYKPLV